MLTRNYIQEHGLKRLETNLYISAKRHQSHANLVGFKYSQTKSPFNNEVVKECRGLILDEANDWNIVAYPFRKFFNAGEQFADQLDWSKPLVQEKLDGSLCIVYYYAGQWNVGTTGSPDGSGGLPAGVTFATLFWQIWDKLELPRPSEDLQDRTLMFEMLTPQHPIIVKPETDRIVLLGLRNNKSLEEEDPIPLAARIGWPAAPTFPLSNLEAVRQAANALNPVDHEGFVIRDQSWRRLKVKSPQYVSLHYFSTQSGAAHKQKNSRNVLQIIRANEGSEFLAYFPDMQETYQRLKQRYDAFLLRVERTLSGQLAREQALTPLLKDFRRWKEKEAGGNPETDAVLLGRFFQAYDVFKLLRLIENASDEKAKDLEAEKIDAIEALGRVPTGRKKKNQKAKPANMFALLDGDEDPDM